MNRRKARRLKKRWLLCVKLVAFLTTLLATSSCSTSTTGTETVDNNSFCAMYYPVYYDSLIDSPETISSININNALYEQCPF